MTTLSKRRQGLVIGVGSDDAGFELKEALRAALDGEPSVAEVRDFGVSSAADHLPYPNIAITVAESVRGGSLDRAVLICGTGIGMLISANKVPGVRATVAYDRYSVERSILSNNCQVLCLGAKVVTIENAVRILSDWLQYDFDPSSPSARKIEVIDQYERDQYERNAPRRM